MFEVSVGLNKAATYQKPFPRQMDCPHCRSTARIALTAIEQSSGTPDKGHVCNLHRNTEKAFWPHDCIAFAIYFCKECREAMVIWNQA